MWAANVELDALYPTFTYEEINEQIPKLRKFNNYIKMKNFGININTSDIDVETFDDCNVIQNAVDEIGRNSGN